MIILALVRKYANMDPTIPDSMNGTNIMGLNAIGAPKIIGSLILKIPQGSARWATSRKVADLDFHHIRHNGRVLPTPPIIIQVYTHGSVNTWGYGCPRMDAAVFSAILVIKSG